MSSEVTPNEPRPAATVVVVRESAGALETLLVRRNDKVAFMAGAHVFPGGRVDPGDRQLVPGARFLGEPARFADLDPRAEWPFRAAAIRELHEEASVSVDIDDLVPIAHWVTPEVEIRRYDTRFYLAVMPAGQDARHDESETTELVWLHPDEAVEQARRGHILLPPPTWTTLWLLAQRRTLGTVLAWARSKPIVRVMPGFIDIEGQTILTLPGDPLYPTLEGWEVPEETRFALTGGRGWLPVRP